MSASNEMARDDLVKEALCPVKPTFDRVTARDIPAAWPA
jgi:hypothetical protein